MRDQVAIEVQGVDPESVNEWLETGEIVLVDVRETKEFECEHIPGALLMPLSSLEPDMFPTLPGKRLVLHCAIGKRSHAAGKMLIKEGHFEVYHMEGGLNAWKAAGLATEIQCDPAPQEAPKPVFLCPTPGAVLREEFLDPHGISGADLAGNIGLTETTIARLLAGEVAVDVELSLRLARYFSTAADFWIHLQIEHDLERARHAIGETIRREIRPRAA